MTFTERNKVVSAFQAQDINGSGVTGDYVSLKGYRHCTIILQAGTVGATANITVNKATDVSGTGAVAITFKYKRDTNVASGDALPATFSTSSSLATGTNNNQMTVIEIDADELGAYDCINVNISDPGSSSVWNGVYILSESRYEMQVPPSAIVD